MKAQSLINCQRVKCSNGGQEIKTKIKGRSSGESWTYVLIRKSWKCDQSAFWVYCLLV